MLYRLLKMNFRHGSRYSLIGCLAIGAALLMGCESTRLAGENPVPATRGAAVGRYWVPNIREPHLSHGQALLRLRIKYVFVIY